MATTENGKTSVCVCACAAVTKSQENAPEDKECAGIASAWT